MATTISPSTGAGALFTAEGVGTSPGYSSIDLRRSGALGLQEGVYAADDFEVTQRAAGANMSVDVAAGSGAYACVQGDTITGQGLYVVAPHSSATINEAVTTADGSNPRVDQVILEVLDNQHDAGGSNLARVRVLAGTATSGATLTNRTGAAALPSSALLLADVLVPASDTTIANSQIRDRRKWARGAYFTVTGAGSGHHTTVSTSFVDLTAYQARIECSGAPLEIELTGYATATVDAALATLAIMSDGSEIVSSARVAIIAPEANAGESFDLYVSTSAITAGSHLILPAIASSSGASTASLLNSGNYRPRFTIREVVRQQSANNTTSSG